jgi:acetyl-CoA synthetase
MPASHPSSTGGRSRRVELRQLEAERRAGGERGVHEFFEEDF